jgi:hypothetical protein
MNQIFKLIIENSILFNILIILLIYINFFFLTIFKAKKGKR